MSEVSLKIYEWSFMLKLWLLYYINTLEARLSKARMGLTRLRLSSKYNGYNIQISQIKVILKRRMSMEFLRSLSAIFWQISKMLSMMPPVMSSSFVAFASTKYGKIWWIVCTYSFGLSISFLICTVKRSVMLYREIWIRNDTMLSRMFGCLFTESSSVCSLRVNKAKLPAVVLDEPLVRRR